MDSMSLKDFAAKWTMGLILIVAYVFLYTPIVHILFASLSNHPNFPYPPNFNRKRPVSLLCRGWSGWDSARFG
ncbi:hypothetical protein [Cypionkella sp. TWP1-2-1b2]|uniref:hypothetical protein n=1 Tax=Cypionkella sp. TWP1-2-1b2 TaxID=2804675 RepID=UPI003CE7787F